MSEQIDLISIAGLDIRQDGGRVVALALLGDGRQLAINISAEHVRKLFHELMPIERALRIKGELAHNSPSLEESWEAMPRVIFVEDLQCVLPPNGERLDLQIQGPGSPELQICLLPAQTRFLFEALLQAYNPGPEQPPQ